MTKVTICVGAGGVGKTTVSSIIALERALLGRRVLLITLDPARRLMDALSLEEACHEPVKVDIDRLTARAPKENGELFALMPDLKSEWMDFLEDSIHRSDVRHEITSNHFYRYMVEGLPGAFEIICSHIMFRLMKDGRYDDIILDTPPSSHSISFFEVPKKISRVLNQSLFNRLIKSRKSMLFKVTKRIAFLSGGILEKTLERIIGSHFLSELIDFALTIDALYEPLLERTTAMEELLKSQKTRYVLISRPTFASVNDCISVAQALKEQGVGFDELIINQVMPHLDDKAVDDELQYLPRILTQEQYETVLARIARHRRALADQKGLMDELMGEFGNLNKRVLFQYIGTSDRIGMMQQLVDDYKNNEMVEE